MTEPAEIPIILIHGLGQRPISMALLARRLSRRGFTVYNFGYPTRSGVIKSHVARLADFLEARGLREVDIVAHSLGGIVTRAFLSERRATKVRRLVMLGPPNTGSSFACGLLRYLPTRSIWGPIFTELCDLALPPPHDDETEIGIIAGDCSSWLPFWPFLEGRHDGLVHVEETKLPQMKAHIVCGDAHGYLPFSKRTAALVESFIRNGSF